MSEKNSPPHTPSLSTTSSGLSKPPRPLQSESASRSLQTEEASSHMSEESNSRSFVSLTFAEAAPEAQTSPSRIDSARLLEMEQPSGLRPPTGEVQSSESGSDAASQLGGSVEYHPTCSQVPVLMQPPERSTEPSEGTTEGSVISETVSAPQEVHESPKMKREARRSAQRTAQSRQSISPLVTPSSQSRKIRPRQRTQSNQSSQIGKNFKSFSGSDSSSSSLTLTPSVAPKAFFRPWEEAIESETNQPKDIIPPSTVYTYPPYVHEREQETSVIPANLLEQNMGEQSVSQYLSSEQLSTGSVRSDLNPNISATYEQQQQIVISDILEGSQIVRDVEVNVDVEEDVIVDVVAMDTTEPEVQVSESLEVNTESPLLGDPMLMPPNDEILSDEVGELVPQCSAPSVVHSPRIVDPISTTLMAVCDLPSTSRQTQPAPIAVARTSSKKDLPPFGLPCVPLSPNASPERVMVSYMNSAADMTLPQNSWIRDYQHFLRLAFVESDNMGPDYLIQSVDALARILNLLVEKIKEGRDFDMHWINSLAEASVMFQRNAQFANHTKSKKKTEKHSS